MRAWRRAAGWLLALAGVVLIRASEPVRDLLGTRPALGRILFHANPDVLRRFPETLLAGCVLFLFAGVLLIAGSSRPDGPPDAPPPALPPRIAWPLLMPLPALLLFYLAQRLGLLASPFATIAYVALLFGACAPLVSEDRRQGLRLGFSLSRSEKLACLAGSLAVFAFYASGLDSWNVAFAGDDWPFFEWAEHLARKPLWSVPWLEGNGPDGHWPMLLCGWQSLFIRLFGATNFVWRSSMSILTVSALVPLYLLLRRLLAPVTAAPGIAAFVGCGCFFGSEIILAWARTGLGNAALSLPLIISSALMLAGLDRGTRTHFLLAGITAGAGCFFSPLAALFPLTVLPAFLVLDAVWPGRRAGTRTGFASPLAFFLAGSLLGAAPILVQFGYLSGLFQLNFVSAEARGNAGREMARTIEAALSFLQFGATDRFLFRNVLDPLMAILAMGGILQLRRLPRRLGLFGLVSLLFASFVSGGLAMYAMAPVTRILPVMVPVSLFAAAGFALLVAARPVAAGACAVLIVSMAAALNASKFATWNPYQSQTEFPNIEMKRIEESPRATRHVLFLPPGPTDEKRCLALMRRAYGLEDRLFLLEDDDLGLHRLEELVGRYGSASEVRVGQGRNLSRITEIAERHGARMGPAIASAVLPAPAPRSFSFRFAALMNTWPPL